MIIIKLESGRFRIGEKVVVSIHGKKYSRRVHSDAGKPYIRINKGIAYENDISNNRRGQYDNHNSYTMQYIKDKKDKISLLTEKGTKDIWKKYAADQGMSLNAFVIYCVEKEIHG